MPTTWNIDIREIIAEELRKYWSDTLVVSYSGFKFRILFYRYGYGVHYAEHVVDPRDGREKLVMACPHLTHAGEVLIYDLKSGEVEWVAKVPGSSVRNPHVAHMIADENIVTGSWTDVAKYINASPGDIIAPAMDNTWVVIDRDSKQVKNRIVWPVAKWVHDIIPSVDGKNLIVSDYRVGFAKITPDGSTVWSFVIDAASKLSFIEYDSVHNPSYGGRYLAVRNKPDCCVSELNDSGSLVWGVGTAYEVGSGGNKIDSFWPFAPHSAFRVGVAENNGSLTVIGFEGGGGIVAVDYNRRPRWGIMKPFNYNMPSLYMPNRRPTSFGLAETTHVFPTLRGTIGFVDWSGKYGSIVGEIVEIPYHQTLVWALAHDHDPGDNWFAYDPPLETMEWSTVKITFINFGANSLDYAVDATNMPYLLSSDYPSHWKRIATGSVTGGSVAEVDASGYIAVRVLGKRTTAGAGSTWKIMVTLKR